MLIVSGFVVRQPVRRSGNHEWSVSDSGARDMRQRAVEFSDVSRGYGSKALLGEKTDRGIIRSSADTLPVSRACSERRRIDSESALPALSLVDCRSASRNAAGSPLASLTLPCLIVASQRCVAWGMRRAEWRKSPLRTHNLKIIGPNSIPALNLPRARAECSATKLDFAAGDSERALDAKFRVETP